LLPFTRGFASRQLGRVQADGGANDNFSAFPAWSALATRRRSRVSPVRTAEIVYPAEDICREPFDAFTALRESAPVHKVPGREEFLVSRHADVIGIMRRPELFSRGSGSFHIPCTSRTSS
jgi:cytochrome P450